MKLLHYLLFFWTVLASWLCVYFTFDGISSEEIGAFIYFMFMTCYIWLRGEPRGDV